jgi:hypothetical protein
LLDEIVIPRRERGAESAELFVECGFVWCVFRMFWRRVRSASELPHHADAL